jgi:hypothetical protein
MGRSKQGPGRTLVKRATLTNTQIESFQENGFLRIRNLLTAQAVKELRSAAKARVAAARDIGATYGKDFERLSYGLGESDIFKKIYTSNAFRTVFGELVATRVIATECNGFELSPGKSGFPWHYGSLSFRFIRAEDMAWSVWIPLDPIDTSGQGGGMAYVPENLVSCGANYQISAILAEMKKREEPFEDITASLDRLFGFEGRFTTDIFERNKVEDSFALGDVFVFNKNVWHRSSPLRPGHLKSRLAVNMRFVDWRSRLDTERYEGEAETGGGLGLGVDFGHQRQTTFGSHFTNIAHGDELRRSCFCGEII